MLTSLRPVPVRPVTGPRPHAGPVATLAPLSADRQDSSPSGRLPGGRHGLSAEFVARSQRDRALNAIIVAVAEKGYQDTSVADVLKGAGISRKTFYEHFADKEACFLAAYEHVFAAMLERMRTAYGTEEAWPQRISAGLAALLDLLASEPGWARTSIVEALAAGQNAIDRRNVAFAVLQGFFDPGRPEVPDHGVPPIVVEATIGGIHEILYRRIVADGPDGLRELHPELTYLALSPFVGAEAATEAAGIAGPGSVRRP